MPLGWERINAKTSAPNKNIVFIKPRPGPNENTSKDFLERIAAQCLPVMNKHYLAVASLEEYEPNLEFWGRNFNNGEVIQLVLKSPSTGRWLPFKFVQMVMMHELAHIKEMNHSKAFWKVKNEFSAEMKELWDRGYTGDGLWGRGVLLQNGAFEHERLGEGEILPEHLCGGGFVSKGGRKRKIRPKITYKEQKERRIRKKFGTNGMTLGADEATKVKLEKGKRPVGKPRVAGSARGRELRAAAALSRFEAVKEEPKIKEEDLVTDSETESEDEMHILIKTEPNDAIDIDGKHLLDSKGKSMVKVCEDEDKNDDNAREELAELQALGGISASQFWTEKYTSDNFPDPKANKPQSAPVLKSKKPSDTIQRSGLVKKEKVSEMKFTAKASSTSTHQRRSSPSSGSPNEINQVPAPANSTSGCPVCSVENEPEALTCVVCTNVLRPEFVANTWKCSSCSHSKFLNAGDSGICGICGARKPS